MSSNLSNKALWEEVSYVLTIDIELCYIIVFGKEEGKLSCHPLNSLKGKNFV